MTLVGGQEFIEYKTDYLRSGARQFEKVNFGLADMSLGASPDKVVTRLESDKMLSYFMRANYNFKEKYLFAASIRADASSKFGSNHKWGVFPAASFAWRASERSLLSNWVFFSKFGSNHKWGVFPAASFAWRASERSLLSNWVFFLI